MNARVIGLWALCVVGTAGIATPAAAQTPAQLTAIAEQGERGDPAGALERLAGLMADGEPTPEALFLRGLLTAETGDVNTAIALFTELTRDYPRLPEAFNNLAALHVRQGNYEQARQALLGAIANTPEFTLARANLGDLYIKMATDAYREALSRDDATSSMDSTEVEAKLDFLRKMFEDS